MKHIDDLGLLLIVALGAGCVPAERGTAVITGTRPNSDISGTATLVPTAKGLRVTVRLAHVPPGQHGLHVHDHANCGDGGNAAGGHFNPDKAKHGFLPKDGFTGAHAGDLGNIEIGADGTGTLTLMAPGLTLREGPHAVAGRSMILHEKRDDFGQPTGNAGGRIACGVIAVSP